MSLGFLNFSIPKPGWLNFGATGSPDPEDNELTILATLPALAGNLQFITSQRLQRHCSASWANRVSQSRTNSIPLNDSRVYSCSSQAKWNDGHLLVESFGVAWSEARPQLHTVAFHYGAGFPVLNSWVIRASAGQTQELSVGLPWQDGYAERRAAGIVWKAGHTTERVISASLDSAIPERRDIAVGWHRAIPTLIFSRIVWDNGIPPPHGWRVVPPVPPPSIKFACRLNFTRLHPNRLDFRACFGSGQLLVPIQRSYLVINSGTLIRVSDGSDIPCSSITIALDRDSWSWRLSATLIGKTAYDTVPIAPGLVRATLNGFSWDFIPDSLSYDRVFGKLSATLSGLSPAAVMISPAATKSYRESATKTAAQLALQELPFEWSLDWQIVDWTIPGDQLQYENLTPLEAMIRVVKSAGGWLFADRQLKTLFVKPRWPQKPWDWTSFTPDASLPSSYVLKETGQSTLGSTFEAILITGGVDGMAVLVNRAGTGGLTYAPTVVDRLITDMTAAQARAIQELADGWPLKHYSLELPLQAQPQGAGLIVPGTTLDFVDGEDGWRGLVTGVSINATSGKTIQTLELVSP